MKLMRSIEKLEFAKKIEVSHYRQFHRNSPLLQFGVIHDSPTMLAIKYLCDGFRPLKETHSYPYEDKECKHILLILSAAVEEEQHS